MFIPHYVSCFRCHESFVTCLLSGFTCDVSHVTCHMSNLFFPFWLRKKKEKNPLKKWDKVVEPVGGGSVINRAYHVQFYQQCVICGENNLSERPMCLSTTFTYNVVTNDVCETVLIILQGQFWYIQAHRGCSQVLPIKARPSGT